MSAMEGWNNEIISNCQPDLSKSVGGVNAEPIALEWSWLFRYMAAPFLEDFNELFHENM